MEKSANEAVSYFSDKLGFTMAASRLKEIIDSGDSGYVVIDARHCDPYSENHIPGAQFVDTDLPVDQWELGDLEKTYVFYCYSEYCHRAARACLAAAIEGYKVMELHGGFEVWEGYPMPLES